MCQIKTVPSQTEKPPFSLAQPVDTATLEPGAAAALISNSLFLLNFICFLSSCVPKVNNCESQTAWNTIFQSMVQVARAPLENKSRAKQ